MPVRSVTAVAQAARTVRAVRSVPAAARRALSWPVASQEVARRNAMLAGTALTQRRVERLEVEEFLVAHLARRADRPALAHRAG